MARTEDSQNGVFTAKKFVVVEPTDQPRYYKSVWRLLRWIADNQSAIQQWTQFPKMGSGEAELTAGAANVAVDGNNYDQQPRGADPLKQSQYQRGRYPYAGSSLYQTAREGFYA